MQRSKGADLVLLEGFKKLVGKNTEIPKIVAVKSVDEALEALKTFKPILVFTGLERTENPDLNAPYMNMPTDSEKIAKMVEKYVKE